MMNTIIEVLTTSNDKKHFTSIFEDIFNEAEKFGAFDDDKIEGLCVTEWQNWTILEDDKTVTFADGTNDGDASITFNKVKDKFHRFEYADMWNVLPAWVKVEL